MSDIVNCACDYCWKYALALKYQKLIKLILEVIPVIAKENTQAY